MKILISPTVAVSATAYPYGERLGPLEASGLTSRQTWRVSAAPGLTTVTAARHALRRLFAALGDIGVVVLVIYAIPFAILAVGIPIALLVRAAMWGIALL